MPINRLSRNSIAEISHRIQQLQFEQCRRFSPQTLAAFVPSHRQMSDQDLARLLEGIPSGKSILFVAFER
jgi:hypothetical protein